MKVPLLLIATLVIVLSGPLIFAVAFTIGHAPRAQPVQPVPSLEGEYLFEGVAPDAPYHGTAVIQQRGRIVLVHWTLSTGKSFTGIGLIHGLHVSVGYTPNETLGGVVVYLIDQNKLIGEWPHLDANVYYETLTRKKPGQPL